MLGLTRNFTHLIPGEDNDILRRVIVNSSKMEDAGFIMLMGLTGSGKSTFISRLTGQQPQETGVGHSLASSTVDIACYTAQYDQTRIIRLIDTPGFDDTTRPNVDILNHIATRLSTLSRARERLLGIICLHRITDVRLSGSAIRNFTILKKLCGPQSYDKIVLATTMWSEDCESTALELQLHNEEQTDPAHLREERLAKYWGDMFQGKSQMIQHICGENPEEAARRTVGVLLERNATSEGHDVPRDWKYYMPLQIQYEMVGQGMALEETEVGRFVRGEDLSAKLARLDREIARKQEMVEKARRGDDNGALKRGQVVRADSGSSTLTLRRKRQQHSETEEEDGGFKGYLDTVARSTGMVKEFFGSLFGSKDERRQSDTPPLAPLPSKSTADLAY